MKFAVVLGFLGMVLLTGALPHHGHRATDIESFLKANDISMDHARDALEDFLRQLIQDILAEIQEPTPVNDQELSIEEPRLKFIGQLTGAELHDLSSIVVTKVSANLILLNIEVALEVPSTTMIGHYGGIGSIDLKDYGMVSLDGAGPFSVTVGRTTLSAGCRLTVENLVGQIGIANLKYDLKFLDFDGKLENLKVGGQDVDWKEYSANFKELFDTLEAEMHSELIVKITEYVNLALDGIRLIDLIGGK